MINGNQLVQIRLKALADQPFIDPTKHFTCETCENNDNCESAFDAYNTDGDCLESK
jgi:hypothetical protein